jgi:hypothetical protein
LNPQVVVICGLFVCFFRLRNLIILNIGREMIMTKMKGNFNYIKGIRGGWVINPRTRVQENEMKNKKKRRQEEKKLIKDGFE